MVHKMSLFAPKPQKSPYKKTMTHLSKPFPFPSLTQMETPALSPIILSSKKSPYKTLGIHHPFVRHPFIMQYDSKSCFSDETLHSIIIIHEQRDSDNRLCTILHTHTHNHHKCTSKSQFKHNNKNNIKCSLFFARNHVCNHESGRHRRRKDNVLNSRLLAALNECQKN